MIRVVITVLLAVALLSVSLPVLDDARAETTAERIGTEGERIERAAAAVTTDSVAVAESTLAARTTLVVRAPSGFGAAPIHGLSLVNVDAERTATKKGHGGSVDGNDETNVDWSHRDHATAANVALTYRIRGGSVRALPIPDPTETVGLVVVDGPIPLRSAGESRLELRFVDDEKQANVRIERVG